MAEIRITGDHKTLGLWTEKAMQNWQWLCDWCWYCYVFLSLCQIVLLAGRKINLAKPNATLGSNWVSVIPATCLANVNEPACHYHSPYFYYGPLRFLWIHGLTHLCKKKKNKGKCWPFPRCQCCWPEKHNKQMRVKCQNHCLPGEQKAE